MYKFEKVSHGTTEASLTQPLSADNSV